jgi:C-terminal processing protease CtpA/Prc
MSQQKSPYTSRRINIENEIDESAPFGNVMIRIDGTPYQGKDFVFSAAVKMKENSAGHGQLWFRVDRKGNKRGFFENMRNRPIKSVEWKEYKIEGTIDDDAKWLNIGSFLKGEGELFFDEASLKVFEDGSWEEIELADSGFEKGALKKKFKNGYWVGRGRGYQFESTKEEAFKGKRSIKIAFEGMTYKEKGADLFEAQVVAGEIVEEKLSENTVAQIPLALYIHENKTLPKVESIAAFNQKLEAYKEKSTEELEVRLANVIELYALVKHFYPYLEVSEANLEQLLEAALKKSFTDETDADHVETLEAMTAPLNDGHIRIYGKSYQRHAPDIRWEWIEEKLVITKVLDSSLTLSVGDIVEKVNDQPAEEYYRQYLDLVSSSTKLYRQHEANAKSLLGKEGSEISIEIDGQEYKLERTHNFWSKRMSNDQKTPQFKNIDAGISYINLNSISMDSIQSLLPELEKSQAIIFDLRKYPNGNHGVMELLMQEKDTNMAWMQIPQYVYPNQKQSKETQKHGWGLKPSKPYLGDKKIVFITSAQAISYAESFMGIVEGYDLGTIVGEPTAGTNGNINTIVLNDDVRFTFTGMLVYKYDENLLYGRGITPDVKVQKTIAGVKAGKDEFLEKAIEVAKQ